MEQIQLSYKDDASFQNALEKIRSIPFHKCLFRIFSAAVNPEKMLHISSMIHQCIPDALIAGCSTNGNIQEGRLCKEGITVVCMAFQDTGSQVEVLSFPMHAENEKEAAEQIAEAVGKRKWVKAVEIYAVIRGLSLTSFCHGMAEIEPSVQIFGGGAFAEDINDNNACVLSNTGVRDQLAVVLYGGENLHVEASLVTGWKPLGRLMHVTKSDHHGRVYELDGKPAYEVYNHYLHIAPDHNFFRNTLEFPFLYDNEGTSLLRAPVSCGEDGSLQMTSDMEQGSTARIAFGDPDHILAGIHSLGKKMEEFQPQGILLFSCAARRYFWGDSNVNKEIFPFESLASTAGFFSSSEFLRQKGILQQHNVTLVTAVFREGGRSSMTHAFQMKNYESSDEQSVIARLARFVEVSTQELEDANQKLAYQSVTDGLTGLYNRMEIQRRITETVGSGKEPVSLIMIDIDYFKEVNDTCGHKEGDLVLQCLSSLLKNQTYYCNEKASAGRWGGEEFMILLPDTCRQDAGQFAEMLRQHFQDCRYPHAAPQTISLGVTQHIAGESADLTASRVDKALYQAKQEGRNRIVCL